MNYKPFLYVILAVILAILSGLLFFNTETAIQEINDDTQEEIINEQGSDQDEEPQEPNQDSSGGSSSESSDSGGGGSDGSQDSCNQKQIAYSLQNFDEVFTCQEYTINGCVHLQANCSVEIHNLDQEINGEFSMSFDLVDEEQTLGSIQDSANLNPGESTVLGGNWDLQDTNGINENLDCDFTTEDIPTKESC